MSYFHDTQLSPAIKKRFTTPPALIFSTHFQELESLCQLLNHQTLLRCRISSYMYTKKLNISLLAIKNDIFPRRWDHQTPSKTVCIIRRESLIKVCRAALCNEIQKVKFIKPGLYSPRCLSGSNHHFVQRFSTEGISHGRTASKCIKSKSV